MNIFYKTPEQLRRDLALRQLKTLARRQWEKRKAVVIVNSLSSAFLISVREQDGAFRMRSFPHAQAKNAANFITDSSPAHGSAFLLEIAK